MSEEKDRIIINSMLEEAGWVLKDSDGERNVDFEVISNGRPADYILSDKNGFPLCVLEAKREDKDPLVGKEQARIYAQNNKCRFVILSNGHQHYFWDTKSGNPLVIRSFPTQEELENKRDNFNPNKELFKKEEIQENYVALTQFPEYEKNPEYLNEETREEFSLKNKLRFFRPYQLEALLSVQQSVNNGNDRFLLEMATGTGKTLISSAIIKFFLRSSNVKRVLFLVDRLELEDQAEKEFAEVLKNDFSISIWKENKSDWKKSEIVVSTVQSLLSQNKYKRIFKPNDFDLVISDEAHRSLGGQSRRVFEYFNGYKLGLTATPKNYLKSVDTNKLAMNDPRALEIRMILDSYNTFGCASGEPTFRYSLIDGVKDGFLIDPITFDARTEISTQLLSEKGYTFKGTDDEGQEVEEIVTQRQFEKKYVSESTNALMCKTFLENAKKDPFTGEIGKSLIFCVSQKHAAKITQILNQFGEQMYPGKYQSDFAVQVTSDVADAQDMTRKFRNNNLNGLSKANDYYKTSKTRICVTVGMMTTGYDCSDILNIGLMRPIFSPADFVQMKGRGTRKHDFAWDWKDKRQMPELVSSQKENFHLIDFFGNYEFFEEEYEYDQVLKLPKKPGKKTESTPELPPVPVGIMVDDNIDKIASIETFTQEEGMKVDRMFFNTFASTIKEQHPEIRKLILTHDYEAAADYLIKNVLDKPDEYFTMEKLQRSIKLDRNLTPEELLKFVHGLIDHIPTKRECLEEDFEKFDNRYMPEKELVKLIKHVFEAYILDQDFRAIIDNKEFAKLNVHASGSFFKRLPEKYRALIPLYINDHVSLNRYTA